jgi:hypothetical protein
VVEECRGLPGYEVFKYIDGEGAVRDVKSHDLNAYVKEVVGARFTVKDFRTWAGTLIAASSLARLGATEDPKAAQKNFLSAVDEVAHRLGNTRDIARASYVSPRLIENYLEGSVVAYYAERLEEIIGRGAGWPRRGRGGPAGAPEQEAPPRAGEGRVERTREGGTVKKAIALKLIKSPTVRKAAVKALQNKKVRGVVTKQVTKRVFGR